MQCLFPLMKIDILLLEDLTNSFHVQHVGFLLVHNCPTLNIFGKTANLSNTCDCNVCKHKANEHRLH